MSDLSFNTIKKRPKGALEILPHPTLVGIKWRVSYCMTPYDQVANDLPLGPFFWSTMYDIVSVVSFFHNADCKLLWYVAERMIDYGLSL